MFRVMIGTDTRDAKDADRQWLCNQIDGRRRNNEPVCVRVEIKDGDGVNLYLQTPGCPMGPGGTRRLTPSESKIIDEWHERHLDRLDFSCGDVHAFLVQVAHIIG